MNPNQRRAVRLALPTLLAALAMAAQAAPPALQGRSCHLPGAEEGMRCITVPVELDYAQPGRAKIGLHVTLAPAFRESARPDPLFILAGGPGEAGSDVLPLVNSTFRRARATRDIVFIDQRGTGLSGKLDCDSAPEAERQNDAEQLAELKACLARLKVPLSAYGTASAARDIEQVRLAMGYGKVNLWGGTLVLDGVAAPDQVIPAGGRDGQAALDLLFRQCAADSACHKAYPALRSEFETLAARLKAAPLTVKVPDPRTAEPLQVEMTSARFLGTVHSVLYSALDSRRLPFLIHSAHQGRWAPFIARRNVATDFSADAGVALVLHLAVVCAEDYPRMTAALLAEDGKNSFLAGIKSDRLLDVCKTLALPPVPWRAPATIAAPALLLSGALDPVTPPRRAEDAARHLRAAQHLVVANAGHGISSLGCAPRLIREFLDKPEQNVAAKCLTDIPAATFQVGSAGPHP